MTIRDYEAKDFESIVEINNVSYEQPAPKNFILDSIEKGHAWVSVEGDKVVGFLIGYVKNGTPYINNIAISPYFRKNGIATQLITKFEELFGMNQKPETKLFWLQVDSSNPAQKLYFDLGYRVGWVDQNYYGWAKHALCMYKSARPLSEF